MTTAAPPRPPAPPAKLTSDDLLRMGDAGAGFELVRGRLQELNVSTESSRVGGKVYARLDRYCEERAAGWAFPPETGFRCFSADAADPDRVRKPDAAFVSFAALPVERYQRTGYGAAVPDLVAEVISPNDNAVEVEEKIGEWLAAGVRVVWELYPDSSSIRAYRAGRPSDIFGPADTLTAPDVLPGFAVPVAELFRLPPPPAAP